jgi:hypothetical protein
MTNREEALRRIAVGDIFSAEGSSGSTRICLTMSVTETIILARNIPTQAIYEFDRRTGVAVRYFSSTPYYYTIDSVAALPANIHEILLGLDRKYREGEYKRAEDPEWQRPPSEVALTEDQSRALLFVSHFYPENPI